MISCLDRGIFCHHWSCTQHSHNRYNSLIYGFVPIRLYYPFFTVDSAHVQCLSSSISFILDSKTFITLVHNIHIPIVELIVCGFIFVLLLKHLLSLAIYVASVLTMFQGRTNIPRVSRIIYGFCAHVHFYCRLTFQSLNWTISFIVSKEKDFTSLLMKIFTL